MKHSMSTVVALALGLGLAAATPVSAADLQGTAPTTNREAAAPGQMRHAAKLSQQQVREAQQQLKSAGFYKGPIDGMMSHRMRLAIAKFQRHNGLPHTATLDQKTFDHLAGGQGMGAGSSTPTTLKGKPGTSGATSMSPPPSMTTNGAGGSSTSTNLRLNQ